MTPSKEELYAQLLSVLDDLFEIEAEAVSMASSFAEDLDIDSIDAVDMMVRFRELTGHRVEPEAFKKIRTVADCVDELQKVYSGAA